MVVGICLLSFALPANNSLKGKRSVVRRTIDRTRARYNAAVAEVGDQDMHRRATLGISVVSSDTRHANSMIDKIADFATQASGMPVIRRAVEFVHVNEEHAADVAGEWDNR